MREVKISVCDLPARPRPLAQSELTSVYGGCGGHNTTCIDKKDCCSNACMDVGLIEFGICS